MIVLFKRVFRHKLARLNDEVRREYYLTKQSGFVALFKRQQKGRRWN